jgi:hypothetical protein
MGQRSPSRYIYKGFRKLLVTLSAHQCKNCIPISLHLLYLFQSEAGCRVIINTYVSYAIDQARRHSDLDFIAVFLEVKVDHPGIPPLGKVSGLIDYLVAKTDGRDPYEDGDIVSAVDPALAIIEVKKSDSVVQKASMAQLLSSAIVVY